FSAAPPAVAAVAPRRFAASSSKVDADLSFATARTFVRAAAPHLPAAHRLLGSPQETSTPMKTATTVVLFAGLLAAAPLAASEETVTFAPFGTVHLYSQTPRPKSVVIFISGDGGWKLGVVDMARALVPQDALVAGIDITRYLKE